MKPSRILLIVLFLIIGNSLLMAQGYNPTNPPEPSTGYIKYKIKTSSTTGGLSSGGGSYSEGEVVTINTSASSTSYVFKHWLKDGEFYSNSTSFSYTVEAKNVHFRAVYDFVPSNPAEPFASNEYSLYLGTNIAGSCSFNRTSGAKVEAGTYVDVTAYPSQGYIFQGWYLGDVLLGSTETLSYQMPQASVTLKAVFEVEVIPFNPSSPSEPNTSNSGPITPKVRAKTYSRQYGERNPVFGYAKNSDFDGIPIVTCEATEASPVGSYPVVISKGTVGDDVQLVNGTLVITKATLTISAGSYTKKQGEDNPEFTLIYSGFKNNETKSVLSSQPVVTCSADKNSPAGTYDVKVSGAAARNYNIVYVSGKLTVESVNPSTPENTLPPEPQGTSFVEEVSNSEFKEVSITFVVTETSSPEAPTVAITNDEGVTGEFTIPETVTHNGVVYKVTEIAANTFQGNTALTEITIPASVTSIGANAFAGCKNLKSITTYNKTPIDLSTINARGFTRATGDNVFEGVNKETCILYVPEGSVNQYKSAPVWKEFKNVLPIKTSTGIQGVVQTDGEPFDVFNLSGQKVKSNATSLEGLPRGIYIVKGKKVIN